jgi:hypothetical protein
MHVRLRIVRVDGSEAAFLTEGVQAAGTHRVAWDGTGSGGRALASGVYFVALESPDGLRVQKLLLLR